MSLNPNFWKEIDSAPPVHFVCCYPRSGSRWLREILSYAYAERLSSLNFQLYSNVAVTAAPDLASDLYNQVVINAHRYENLVKSESPNIVPTPIYRSHNLSQIQCRQRHKILYLYRSPLAVMRSFYHFHTKWPSGDLKAKRKSLQSWSDRKLHSWIDHLTRAIKIYENSPERICFVKYQDDFPFSAKKIHEMCLFLDIDLPLSSIASASERLKRKFNQMNATLGSAHTRGSNQDQDQYYSAKYIAKINARTDTIYRAAESISL
ncbi:sulfotransferase domain-containing protein [Coraliomargarita sp. W4R53]